MRPIPILIFPHDVIDRIEAAGDAEAQKKEGMAICVETIKKLKGMPGLRGVHILSGGNEAVVPADYMPQQHKYREITYAGKISY